MQNFPESVLRAVEKAVEQIPNDIDAAVEMAERAVMQLDEFPVFSGMLVSYTLRKLVHERRHLFNKILKREAGLYGGGSKVSGTSDAVDRVLKASLYSYHIAGMTLGEVLGKDLEGIADSEREIAEGHTFNFLLCTELAELVPEEKRVMDVVSEKKLKMVFNRVQRRLKDQRGVPASQAGH